MDGTARDSVKVLVVGAGGIGCELLKNLVLDDFRNITLVDLDTIDISNLNRQFLFHKLHVGRPKAEVARESVLIFRPGANISAFHKSIFSSSFDAEFFAGFDIVFNALDNKAARRHVNRLCVAAKRPLIESGSAGYLGQVEPLLPTGLPATLNSVDLRSSELLVTGCYECHSRGAGQRTYPACTIRNTPSEPIHCVVWAKYLFNQLFGEPDIDDEDVSPDMSDPDLIQNNSSTVTGDKQDTDSLEQCNGEEPNQNGIAHNRSPGVRRDVPVELVGTLRTWFQKQWSNSEHSDVLESTVSSASRSLAWRLFHQDITTLVGMRDLWVDREDRKEPTPLNVDTLDSAVNQKSGLLNTAAGDESCGTAELRDQRHLSPAGWLRLFLDSVRALQVRLCSDPTRTFVWDKDDDDAMDFVAGASILRAQLFHLPGADELNRFIIKSLAGNIIPAIATTNAIVAGLMVLQAMHILTGTTKNIRTVYLHRQPTGRHGRRKLVVPCEPPAPNPDCFVCSKKATKSQLGLLCCPAELTLRSLRDRILIRMLGMLDPDVELVDRGVILISSEEGETEEDTLDKPLSDFHVIHGSKLQCDDFRQDFTIQLTVSALSSDAARTLTSSSSTDAYSFDAVDPSEGWRLTGNLEEALSEARSNTEPTADKVVENGVCSDHKDARAVITSSSGRKRQHDQVPSESDDKLIHIELEEASPTALKRPRLEASSDESVNVLRLDEEEDEDDLVILD